MSIRNTPFSYGKVSKTLHWLIALLVLIMLGVGAIMGDIKNEQLQGMAYFLHKSTGVTILALMIIRLIWRLMNPVPSLSPQIHNWEIFAARTSHLLFYIILILMPIDGILMSQAGGYPISYYGLFQLPALMQKNEHIAKFLAELHEIFAWTLFIIIILHVCGALKHHFIDKNNILKRMLPGSVDH